MSRYICIHGHFYQPPRENPWLGTVEVQESAYPYHDWNERIAAECYAPNADARILDHDGLITEIVSTYGRISFSTGPTLLSWMERRRPDIYESILAADRDGQERFGGHGPAIAQGYNHLILPLAGTRDKRTQVVWGVRDFASRFGRRPEGMWLPETAVDLETLDIMAGEGIRFTILAPHQAYRVRSRDGGEWEEVDGGSLDTTVPYHCSLPSGRSIALFFYDGAISHEIAFGDLLTDGQRFAERLVNAVSPDLPGPRLAHVATDGETYGHHRRFTEMALAYCLRTIERVGRANLTVYGEYLERFPPTREVEIRENTSWSCIHGIERWRSGCSCGTGKYPDGTHEWRVGLYEATVRLRERLGEIYLRRIASLVRYPWEMRDDYISLIRDRSDANTEQFLARHGAASLPPEETAVLLQLLEMERQAMLMATSCGWFFDDISELGSVQVMRHAARAMHLAREIAGVDLEEEYVGPLRNAPSNSETFTNGAEVYAACVRPYRMDLSRVAVHFAALTLSGDPDLPDMPAEYTDTFTAGEECLAGDRRFTAGTFSLRSAVTLDTIMLDCAALSTGSGRFVLGARPHTDDEAAALLFRKAAEALRESGDDQVHTTFAALFGDALYPLRNLTRDEQTTILHRTLVSRHRAAERAARGTARQHGTLLPRIGELGQRPPSNYAGFILEADLSTLLTRPELDQKGLDAVLSAMEAWGVRPESPATNRAAADRLNACLTNLARRPGDLPPLRSIVEHIEAVERIPVRPDLRESQKIFFSIYRQQYAEMQQRMGAGNPAAAEWLNTFQRLGVYLKVKIR